MTKNELISEITKIVITTLHGCGYEEALEKELGFGCVVTTWKDDQRIISETMMVDEYDGCVSPSTKDYVEQYDKIIGRPITIGRLMAAMDSVDLAVNSTGEFMCNRILTKECKKVWGYSFESKNGTRIHWQLLRPDGSEADLTDQTIETLKKIYQLIKR